MTNMKRVTVAFPNDVDEAVLNLRKDDRFVKCSYSEIIRRLVVIGLQADERENLTHDHT